MISISSETLVTRLPVFGFILPSRITTDDSPFSMRFCNFLVQPVLHQLYVLVQLILVLAKSKYEFGSPEYLKERLGKHYMTEEDEREFNRKIASGELVVISNDDPYAPYYPPVSLEQSQSDLRQRIEEMKEAGVLDDDNIFMDDKKEMLGNHFITEEEWERRQSSKLRRMQLITLLLFPILLPIMIISMLFDIFVSLIGKLVNKFKSTNKESECSGHDKEL